MSEIIDHAAPIISYSQNSEDIVLWRALSSIDNGFYVDVGANHPVEDSVTQLFYEKGWRGINIEPLEDYFLLLNENRQQDINLQIAVSNVSGDRKFYRVEKDFCGLSTLDTNLAKTYRDREHQIKELTVKTTTLTELFDRHQVSTIHFLKIDVEGEERNVLNGLDLQKYRPWIIIIESISPDVHEKNYENWENILLNNQYSFVFFDGLNRFYLSQEHQELKELIFSANILDNYLPFRFAQEKNNLKNKIKELELTNLSLRAHIIKYLGNKLHKYNHILHGCIHKLKNIILFSDSKYKIIGKLLKFLGVLFLSYLLALIKAVPFFKKIAKKIIKKFPGLSKFSKKIESTGGVSLLLNVLHTSPKLTKITKFVYFKFPAFSRHTLKLLNVEKRNPADLQLALKGKENSKIIENEIKTFYVSLKLILDKGNKV